MKVAEKKAIAALKAEIVILREREIEIENHLDNFWEVNGADAWAAEVAKLDEEYKAIMPKIGECRDKIRSIENDYLCAKGLMGSMNLVAANID
jgi:hypothetical protein